MIRVLAYSLVLLCMSCANSTRDIKYVGIDDILDHPFEYDETIVVVVGCLTRNQYGDAAFHDCLNMNWLENQTTYIDVVSEHTDLPFGEILEMELCAHFRAYSSSYRGMGWLTSEIGILRVQPECNMDLP